MGMTNAEEMEVLELCSSVVVHYFDYRFIGPAAPCAAQQMARTFYWVCSYRKGHPAIAEHFF